MRKPIRILLSFLLCTALLAGCSCEHEWTEATCTTPRHCAKCETAEEEALGHSWKDADCIHPRTCSRCSLTEGDAPGHTWLDATCTAPRTCTVCTATDGEPLGHIWEGEATLYTAPLCTVCGTEGDPLPGYLTGNGLSINTCPAVAVDYTTNTYVRSDLDTTGSLQTSEVQIFTSDAAHPSKNGYEWRRMDITVTFDDSHSGLFGSNVTWALADYYQDLELKQAKKRDRFAVTYNGKEYRCVATYENIGFYYAGDGSIYQMTCYAQVPAGYDGLVLAFYHGSIDIDGMHLHEVKDENMLLVRLA